MEGLILLFRCKAIVCYFSICDTHYCNLQNFQDSDETSSRRSSGYASISKVMQQRPACNSSACTSCRNSWEVHNSFRLTSHKFIYFHLMLKCCIALSVTIIYIHRCEKILFVDTKQNHMKKNNHTE